MSAKERARLRHIKPGPLWLPANLKPMAQQLLENRSPGVCGKWRGGRAPAPQRRCCAAGMAGAGYAHYLDKDYVKARDSWKKAEPLEPVLGDYLEWLRASAWQDENNSTEVLKVLEGFEQRRPMVHLHDVVLLYGNALVATGKSGEAVTFFEKHRTPLSADVEYALASAYQAEGMKDQATETLRKIYCEMPNTIRLRSQQWRPEPGRDAAFRQLEQHYTRAELLMKARRYNDAVAELSSLTEQAPPERMPLVQTQFAAALIRAASNAMMLSASLKL